MIRLKLPIKLNGYIILFCVLLFPNLFTVFMALYLFFSLFDAARSYFGLCGDKEGG